jgi:hypothetical protein
MPILAVALLKLDACSALLARGPARFDLAAESGVRAEALDDAQLLHTGLPFASEPELIVQRLQQALGEALDEHDDPRGVFLLPDVAAPKARAYLDVIDEVGEGGQWLPLPQEAQDFGLPDGLGALSAVLGSMLQHMPESVLEAASAAARGDLDAFSQISEQVAAWMGHGRAAPAAHVDLGELARSTRASTAWSGDVLLARGSARFDAREQNEEDAALASLARLAGDGRSLDLSSPAFQQLLQALEGELEKAPEQVARIRALLFGKPDGEGTP